MLNKATIVKDHTFSVTGHILTNKPEKVIKLGFNWSSFPTSFCSCFVLCLNAFERAISVDIIEILPISPNTLSYKIQL